MTHHGALAPGLSFGLSGLSAHADDESRGAYHRAIRRVVDEATLAEQLGFDAVWVCEHHATTSGYLPAPFVALAAIAEHTDRVSIGTDVMLPSMWDPVRFAEEAAVVDQLSAGRLVLAVGIGYRDVEFESFGYRRRDRVRRLTECVRVLREAATGTVTQVGCVPADQPVPISPLPFQDDGPLVWGGGKAEGAVRRARRIGDGYFASLMAPGGLRRRIGWLDEEEPIGDAFALAQTTLCFVGGDDAVEVAAPGLARLQSESRAWAADQGQEGVASEWKPGDPWQAATPHAHLDPDEQLTPAIVVGTPEQCIERLAPYVRELVGAPGTGVRHLAARLTYPRVSDADNARSVRLFATEVMPALRDLAG
jgi:alkanesulfonate monooxygenase SsuD/methylene tetrahydromethanopterin reductase-like flavin-dependent oxidoreductase (luciferase family)